EQSSRSRVRQDLCLQHYVRRSCRGSPFRPSRSRRIRPELYFALQQGARPLRVHHQQYEICFLPTQLYSDIRTLQRIKRRSSPRTREVRSTAADHAAASEASPNSDCEFLYSRKDHHAFRSVQKVFGDV